MKNTLLFPLFTLLITFCAAAQKVQPIQIQNINDSTYVVEYVPIATAQANVNAQLAQVDKQIASIDKQIADLVARRDKLVVQQKALTVAQAQLNYAASATPPPTSTKSAEPTTPPAPVKRPKKTKTSKPKKE